MTTCTTRTAAFTDHGSRDGSELVTGPYYELLTDGHTTTDVSSDGSTSRKLTSVLAPCRRTTEPSPGLTVPSSRPVRIQVRSASGTMMTTIWAASLPPPKLLPSGRPVVQRRFAYSIGLSIRVSVSAVLNDDYDSPRTSVPI